jgi:hypothetical protein
MAPFTKIWICLAAQQAFGFSKKKKGVMKNRHNLKKIWERKKFARKFEKLYIIVFTLPTKHPTYHAAHYAWPRNTAS